MGVATTKSESPAIFNVIKNYDAGKHYLRIVKDKKGQETLKVVNKNPLNRFVKAISSFWNINESTYNIERVVSKLSKDISEYTSSVSKEKELLEKIKSTFLASQINKGLKDNIKTALSDYDLYERHRIMPILTPRKKDIYTPTLEKLEEIRTTLLASIKK